MSEGPDHSLLIKLVEGQAALNQSMADVRHDIKNVIGSLDNFVPRREIEKDARLHEKEHAEMDKRLIKLENRWVKWFPPILSAICSLIVGAALYMLKLYGG